MAEDLYTGFGNQKILAERAKKDINGNSLELTIENEKVTSIGGVSIGGGSEPVDAYTKAECDSQFMANKKLTGTATIAGREYKTVTIGNQVWLAENLDMKFDGLTVGSTESPSMEELRANYYNNDEETYGAEGNQYGLLYNYPAVKYINDNRATLIPGWHVPTEEEFFTLFRYIGETFDVGTTTTNVATAGLKLKSSSGWGQQQPSGESGNGIDAFGMSVVPSGLYTGNYTNVGTVGNLWTITTKPEIRYNAQGVHFPTDKYAVIYPWFYGNEVGVRLVKDSDNADDLWRKYDDKEFDAKHSDVAERAIADAAGNEIETTYATKTELAFKQPRFYDAGSLTDGSTVNVHNNAIQQLSSSQATLTLNVNCDVGEVPNFAVEISTGAAITLTLTKTVNNVSTTLYPSKAGGTALESGKYYQVTCVGNCWTLAEFVPPSP